MSAIDDWRRLPYVARVKILDALASPGARNAVAEALDPPDDCNRMLGSEMTHDEERDLATALAVLDEGSNV